MPASLLRFQPGDKAYVKGDTEKPVLVTQLDQASTNRCFGFPHFFCAFLDKDGIASKEEISIAQILLSSKATPKK